MKVIAKIDSSKVLCEVSIEELAFLNGFRGQHEKGFDESMTRVGAECNLKKMVTTSRFVRSLRKDTLMQTKANLENIISKLDETLVTVAGLEVFGILSEEEQIS